MLILREYGHKGEVEELSQETVVGSLYNFSLVPSLTSTVLFRISNLSCRLPDSKYIQTGPLHGNFIEVNHL